MNNFSEYLKEYTKNKNICILGFGREGRSTYKMIEKYCSPKSLVIADLNDIDRLSNNLPENVGLICGENYQDTIDDFDIVFKSPGIVLKKSPENLKCEITSETQVFFSVFREQIIGITGTKGKSTVTSLIYHVLNEAGIDCRIAGNIGIPVFDIAEGINEETIIICELSCHQLEYMTVSPSKAVFLNLYEEHLDHYGTLENYYNAKKNIYLHQTLTDSLWCDYKLKTDDIPSNCITVSSRYNNADVFIVRGKVYDSDDGEFEIPVNDLKLLGVHNHYNIAVAWDICHNYVSRHQFSDALVSFNPLPHRLEYIGTFKDIRWYDDSISTACATAVEALKSVPNVTTILIGGMDRGIDYTMLAEYLMNNNYKVICMEASGKRVYDMISEAKPELFHYVPHLKDAVELAADITPKGRSCVLSPAAASYGIFKNFEERGNIFKQIVSEL